MDPTDNNAPRKRGRPPSPRERRRSERVVSFVTESELQEITRIAEHSRQAVSTVIHQFIAQGLSAIKAPDKI